MTQKRATITMEMTHAELGELRAALTKHETGMRRTHIAYPAMNELRHDVIEAIDEIRSSRCTTSTTIRPSS